MMKSTVFCLIFMFLIISSCSKDPTTEPKSVNADQNVSTSPSGNQTSDITQNIKSHEPIREKGISLHMIPKRVAKLSDKPWGFSVAYATYLKEEPAVPYLQSKDQFVAYWNKQDEVVKKNGVWIVLTHPDAYSNEENIILENIKSESKKVGIPLFICRGSELPDGWSRYDTIK